MQPRTIVLFALAWAHAGSAAPNSSAPIGTANPIWIHEYAPDGTWLIACQARNNTDGKPGTAVESSLHGVYGDRLEPYLIWGAGAGARIDAFANQTPDGRWFAVERAGRLELHDASTRRHVVLTGANVEDDGASEPASRVTSFAAAGNRMVYFRKARDRDLVIVRELATGAERVVDIPGVVWRVDIDDAGRWAKVRVVRADTDHDGKIDWPIRVGWIGLRGCFQLDPHMRFATGDEPVTVWLDLTSGKTVDDPTIVHALGDGLLRVPADHSITLDGAALVPASCHGKILAISTAPPRVVVACGAPGIDQGTVGVFGPGFSVLTTHPTSYRDPTFGPVVTSSAHVCPTYGDWCVELATGVLTTLPGVSISVWRSIGELAFVLEHSAETTYVWDAAAGTKRPFTTAKTGYPDVTGAIVTIGNERFDWVRNKYLGTADERIYGQDRSGRVLVGPPQPGPNMIAPGPLHWETR